MEMRKKYNLIIVEDQPQVRNGLNQYFQDRDLGFNVSAVFANGEDAFEWLKKHHSETDVVFTDIKMPKVTGISLAQKIGDEDWNIKVVFLSSYRDFEYAREALNLGVCAYLTKPIQFMELDKVFLELKTALDGEKAFEKDAQALKKEIFSQILSEVYAGGFYTQETLLERLKRARVKESYINMPCEEIVFMRRIVENENNSNWHYGVSRFDNFIFNILKSETIIYHAVLSKNDFLYVLAYPQNDDLFVRKEDFWNAVEKDTDNSIKTIREMIDVDIECDKTIRYDSVLSLWEGSRSVKIYTDNNFVDDGIKPQLQSDIEKALSYINKNYSKEISLLDVAEHIGMNSFSFGKIFKDYTGKHFTDYIIQLRIDKAKDSLQNSKKTIYEISESVGYRDEKYFMRLFKKKTGLTPNEFRKRGQCR